MCNSKIGEWKQRQKHKYIYQLMFIYVSFTDEIVTYFPLFVEICILILY